ncbi:MAG: DNA-binding transcriptional regulator [Candidatus Buchananbacteria bacterium]|nr:DNA-binding transcriptional regulator [Candidatus Buchananbacteria bacterium]
MNWNNPKNQELITAILALKTTDEARRFLRDLMTAKEIEEFANRLKAAEMLTKRITYSKIEKETGLSSTTVARVSKWLKSKNAGYKTIINRISHPHSVQSRIGLS